MAISVPAVGDLWTAALADSVINYVNAANTFLNFTPAGNTDTQVSGTTPTTWITLGTLTVPSWAVSAVITLTINGGFETTAGSDYFTARIGLGSALGGSQPRLCVAIAGVRYTQTWTDSLTGFGTGSQTLIVQATRVSGTGVHRVDVSSFIASQIAFLP